MPKTKNLAFKAMWVMLFACAWICLGLPVAIFAGLDTAEAFFLLPAFCVFPFAALAFLVGVLTDA